LICLCEGEKAVIANASGGYGVTRRLAEMGLTPGVEVTLLRKCPFRGPLQVEVRGVSLALGYGVASKVFVKLSKVKPNG
jgi:Fe2+ transport system protein FeoA